MKKVAVFVFILASMAFSSCGSDDSASSITVDKSLLIGEWEFDDDPGYGDHKFLSNGRVEVKYVSEEWGDDFTDFGDWTLEGNNLKIYWDDADPGSEVYDTNIIELTATKLRWKVMIDGTLQEETFTKK